MPSLYLLPVAFQLLAQTKRGVAGALRVILVRDGRAEERHDAVPRVLVDGPLEAVHTVARDLEVAIQDRVPLLGIDLLSQRHGAGDIREEHSHLLALALQGGLRLENPVGEVLGGVSAGVALRNLRPGSSKGMSTGVTEFLADRVRLTAGGASSLGYERRCAFSAERSTFPVLVAAARAVHLSRTTLPRERGIRVLKTRSARKVCEPVPTEELAAGAREVR